MDKEPKIIIILGPTATGKTRVGVRLAKKFNGEIISADSRQVYIGMDVGTGKDLREYRVKGQGLKIRYHLIDVVEPTTEFNVAKYQKLAYRAIEDILKRGKVPIIVGGTGLYINAVVEGFIFKKVRKQENKKARRSLNKLTLKQLLTRLKKVDSVTYKVIDRQNRRRVQRALEIYYETGQPKSAVVTKQPPPYQFFKIGLNYPKEILATRIEKRLKERLEKEGMVAEAKRLHQQGLGWKKMAEFGLEYRWLANYLQGQISYNEMVVGLAQDSKNFAKRQLTWFKRDQEIVWNNNYKKIEKAVANFLK
ncbi:MAG: tRNA (adenosine(37)-N6)-dimethylallyltransferase MiaA [Patescibacteria group bacterium]